MYVGKIKLKSRLSLWDMVRVFEITTKIDSIKSQKGFYTRWLLFKLLKDLVGILTELKRPRNKHVKKLNEILEGHGLIKKDESKKEALKDTKQRLINLGAWFGTQLKQTPYEILNNMSKEEVQPTYNEIIRAKIKHYLMTALAQHDLKGLNKELSILRRSIKQIVSEHEDIEDTRETFIGPAQLLATVGKVR